MLFSFYRQLLKFFFLHFFKVQIYFNKLSKKKKCYFLSSFLSNLKGGKKWWSRKKTPSILIFSPLTFPSLIFYNIPFTHQPNITLTLVPNSQQPKCKIHRSHLIFFIFGKESNISHLNFILIKKNLIRDSYFIYIQGEKPLATRMG